MWITKVSIKNPVFATMVMVAICVLGAISYSRLGVEQLPDVTFPAISIIISYPGASPAAVENDLTKPIENAVNTVSGIKMIRSNSFEGDSETYVEFRLGTDINRAVQDVRDKIAQIRPGFPREVKDPLIIRADSEFQQPVVQLSIVSATRSVRELTTLTDQIIVKELQKTSGVGRVIYGGGRARQVLVQIHPQELTAYGIGVDQVMDAIRASNQDIAAGRISNIQNESLVRVEGKIKDITGFNHIIVARRGAAGAQTPVYLNQVAEVIDGEEDAQTIARLDGKSAISLSVYKVQDANIVAVGEGIKDSIRGMKSRLPPGVEIVPINYNSDHVQSSLDGVKKTLFEGGVLTVIIVFLFLRSWRSTVITGLTLPIAVMSTFIALYAFGFTLNMMTMMALSLCIGLLIDDAIVVRENIVRHLRMGKDHKRAALEGTEEIGLAVMATTFAIVAVFVPVAFMNGIIGKFFFSFGITVTAAVLVSLFVSFTLDPMLSSVWHDPKDSRVTSFLPLRWLLDGVEHLIERIHQIYARLLDWALHHRIATLVIAFAILVVSLGLMPLIGAEFLPDVDEGLVSLRLTTPVGASLEYADQKTQQVETELHNIPEIAHIDVNIYGESRGTVRLNLKLTPRTERKRTQKELEKVIRTQLSHIAGVKMSIGYDFPIFLNVLGPDDQKLAEITNSLTGQIVKVPGIVDLETSMKDGTPALSVRPIPDVASDLGLTNAAIGNILQPLVAGETVTYWLGPDGQNYEVRVQLPKSGRSVASDIGDLMISTGNVQADGSQRLVPLRQVATIQTSASPLVIKRQNLQRRIGIYANTQGRPSGDVGSDIKKLIKNYTLPVGYQILVDGQQQQQDESGQAALVSLALAVIFIYLILASQFGSFMQPVAIMMSLPFSLIGVMLALALTGTTLNLFSIIGFIMLMGLVTKNAILLVDFANQGQREGKSQFQALLDAGQTRLRPILMTTAAMVFGMLPLAIGVGEGAEEQSPMGRAIIGGVLTSTLLTLVVVPVAYTYLDTWGRRATAWFARAPERRALREAKKAGYVPDGESSGSVLGTSGGAGAVGSGPAAPPEGIAGD